uniref:Heparan-alpha-glucosaminide N-acetyltransferase n=1 Tax=Anthurium amnicola TaxID=1678845 RepID=A0A1D1XS19_9ARAE
MADYVPLSNGGEAGSEGEYKAHSGRASRLASLDVFRGLSIALMVFVDYAGSIFPFIAHSPWNGLRLADFVMPFFLFIVGISLALAYKKISNRVLTTYKAVLRAVKLFLLGILLQGGYFHGVNSWTYGVDVDKIRWLGVLQRIAIGYIVAALCEIWFSRSIMKDSGSGSFKNYYLQWFAVLLISCIYLWLLYGLYVPDWQFKVQLPTSSLSSSSDGYVIKTVKCAARGDLGPACNSAGMIDRYLLGIEHLYKKPTYKNLKECWLENGQVLENSPAWCWAPFEPEGILSSLMAAVTCIIGLQFGHILVQIEDHKSRLFQWFLLSLLLFALGEFLALIGLPLNKSLYTVSYMLITTSSAGVAFCALYLMVDICGYRCLFFVLEWMGRHSLSIFVLVASNLAIIATQGFYWRIPQNNVIHWVITLFVKK